MFPSGPGAVYPHGGFNIFSQQVPNAGGIFQRGTSSTDGISPQGVFNDKVLTNSRLTTRSNYTITAMNTFLPSYTDRSHPPYRHFMFAIGHEMLRMDDEFTKSYKIQWSRGQPCKTVEDVRARVSSATNHGLYGDDARGNWQQYGECIVAANMVQVNRYLASLCENWKDHVEWDKYGKTEYPPTSFLIKMIRPLGVANRQQMDPLTQDSLVPGSNSRTGLGYGISSPNVHPVVVKGKVDVFQYWDQTWIGCKPRRHRLGTNLYFGLRLIEVSDSEREARKIAFNVSGKPEYVTYTKEYIWELAPFSMDNNSRPDIYGYWPEDEQDKIEKQEKNLSRFIFADDENIIYPKKQKWSTVVYETLYEKDDAPTIERGGLKRDVTYQGYWWGIGKYGHFADIDQPYISVQDRNTRNITTCENGVFEIHLDIFNKRSRIIT